MSIRVILASASPRRRELLAFALDAFDTLPANIEESLPEGLELTQGPAYLAAQKARFLAHQYPCLLYTSLRYVDLIDSTFGAEEGKMHGYPGHEIIEMALMKLYELTGEEKHRRLAKYFIDQRGQEPLYFAQEMSEKPFRWGNTSYEYQYYQAGMPVREQKEAQGHAVRAVYLYSGMADVCRIPLPGTLFRESSGRGRCFRQARIIPQSPEKHGTARSFSKTTFSVFSLRRPHPAANSPDRKSVV